MTLAALRSWFAVLFIFGGSYFVYASIQAVLVVSCRWCYINTVAGLQPQQRMTRPIRQVPGRRRS